MSTTFSERLKEVMHIRGIGQKKLGEKIDYSESAVHVWCIGGSEPRLNAIVSLCEVLNVSADWLVLGKGEME